MTDKWKLVPIEPTDEMKRALFTNLVHADDEAYVIKAIINAAPQPPHIEQIASREAFQTLKGTSAYLKLQLAIQDNAPNLKRYESVMLAENLAEFVWQAAQAEQAKLIAELVEALEFYASAKNWHKDSQEYGSFEVSDYNIIYNDFYEQNQSTRYAGSVARQALAKAKGIA